MKAQRAELMCHVIVPAKTTRVTDRSLPKKKFVKKFNPQKLQNSNLQPPTIHTTPSLNTISPQLPQNSPPVPNRETLVKMHLMYTLDAAGKRKYTLKKVIGGEVTKSAHPARFSPDDKYSRHRVTLKKRYGLLLVQQKDLKVLGQ
ncbi:hypothetical protein EAF00_008907 [Botryotinia globosa]|nr:hypothetical protein EAF00_008907 [Botryotinia globosa]